MRKLLLSLFAVVTAVCMTNAAEVTLLTNSDASTWEGDTNGYSTVLDGFTISYTKGSSNNAVAPSGNHIRVYKGATFTVKSNNAEFITGIVINCTGKDHCNTIVVGGEDVVADNTNYTITWTGSLPEFVASSDNGQIRIKSIVVTYGQPAAVAAPTFSPKGGTYYEAQEVTLSCATAGAEIHYTTNGDEPNASSSVYSSPIKVETTTTIKMMAIKGNDQSNIVSATYTIAQPTEVANIAAFNALAKETVVEFTNPVNVIYQNGKYLFVQDATGALQIYGEIEQKYNNGDIIPGGFMGKVDVYGIIQLVPMAETFKPATKGTAIEPLAVTSQEVVDALMNKLVKISNVTIVRDGTSRNYTLTDASGDLNLYSRFTDVAIPEDDKKYDVTGIVNRFNDIQVFPIEIVENTGGSGLVNAESGNSAQVVAGDKAINIEAAESAQVLVVNTLGQVVANEEIAVGANTINVPAGLYIVRINNAVTKVIIK